MRNSTKNPNMKTRFHKRKTDNRQLNRSPPKFPGWEEVGFGLVGGITTFLITQLLGVQLIYPFSKVAYYVYCCLLAVIPMTMLLMLARNRPVILRGTEGDTNNAHTTWFQLFAGTSFIYAYYVGINVFGLFSPLSAGLAIIFAVLVLCKHWSTFSYYVNSALAIFLVISCIVVFFMLTLPERVMFAPEEFYS